jgi:hypothetical protein
MGKPTHDWEATLYRLAVLSVVVVPIILAWLLWSLID